MNQYQVFLKVAEIGNITKTAEILNYTQSGISRMISALEKELGFPLFIRSKKGVTLTDQGEKVLKDIENLCRDQEQLMQKAYSLKNQISGTITVGVFTSVSVFILPKLIRSFKEEYPQVDFKFRFGNYQEIVRWIKDQEIDCGFITERTKQDLRFYPLMQDRMMLITETTRSKDMKASVTLADIGGSELPFILPSRGADADVDYTLKKVYDSLDIKYYLDDDISLISMVSGGFGVSVMGELMIKTANIDISAVAIEPFIYRTIGIAALNDEYITPVTKVFIEYAAC